MPPRRVLVGTYVAFGIAVAAGLYLAAIAGWELLVVGAASILAGVLYTGGPRPYGYEGLGEVFVFLFFGARRGRRLVLRADRGAALGGVRAGRAGRAARLRDPRGQQRARRRHRPARRQAHARGHASAASARGGCSRRWSCSSFAAPVATWLAGGLSAWLLLTLAALPLAPPLAAHACSTRTDGPSLNGALADSGRLLAIFSLLLAAGVLLS